MFLYIYKNKKDKFKFRVCKRYYRRDKTYRNRYDHVLLQILHFNEEKERFEDIEIYEKRINLYQELGNIYSKIRSSINMKTILQFLVFMNLFILFLLLLKLL